MNNLPLIAAEYAPYNKMPEFAAGYYGYDAQREMPANYNQYQAMAWDRGADCARRTRQWNEQNVGAN